MQTLPCLKGTGICVPPKNMLCAEKLFQGLVTVNVGRSYSHLEPISKVIFEYSDIFGEKQLKNQSVRM